MFHRISLIGVAIDRHQVVVQAYREGKAHVLALTKRTYSRAVVESNQDQT